MPIYDYRCKKCDTVEEVNVPVDQRDAPMKHTCGGAMMRLLSLPQPAIIALTGKGMAEDALNSGSAIPNQWYKKRAEEMAKKGLESYQRRIW